MTEPRPNTAARGSDVIAERLGLPDVRGAPWLLVALFVDALGTGLYAPVSLLYFNLIVGLPLPTVGLALSSAALAAIPAAIVTGALVERFGPRRVVVGGEVLQGVGFLLYLLVRDFPSLVVAQLLVAVGLRLFWSGFFPLISEIAAEKERERWFGLAGSAQSAGIGLGGLLAGALLALGEASVYVVVIACDGVSFLLAAGLIYFTVREKRRAYSDGVRPGAYGLLLRDRPFLSLIAANTTFTLCSIMLGVGLPVYAVTALRAPGWVVGVLFALNTAAVALAQTVTVRLLETHRRTRSLVGAGALWAGWCLLMALALSVPPALLVPYLVVATVVFTVAELIHGPTSNALAASASPDAVRGPYLAAFQFSWALANVFAPVIFTLLFGVGPALPWLLVGALALAGASGIRLLEPRLPLSAVRVGGGSRRG
jgi:MFS family permease